jgi:hypothetical protein
MNSIDAVNRDLLMEIKGIAYKPLAQVGRNESRE